VFPPLWGEHLERGKEVKSFGERQRRSKILRRTPRGKQDANAKGSLFPPLWGEHLERGKEVKSLFPIDCNPLGVRFLASPLVPPLTGGIPLKGFRLCLGFAETSKR
jgi:hypothetical protein